MFTRAGGDHVNREQAGMHGRKVAFRVKYRAWDHGSHRDTLTLALNEANQLLSEVEAPNVQQGAAETA